MILRRLPFPKDASFWRRERWLLLFVLVSSVLCVGSFWLRVQEKVPLPLAIPLKGGLSQKALLRLLRQQRGLKVQVLPSLKGRLALYIKAKRGASVMRALKKADAQKGVRLSRFELTQKMAGQGDGFGRTVLEGRALWHLAA